MKTFKEFLEESTLLEFKQGKEYTKDEIMKKINDGKWEADNDVTPGKSVDLRTKSGKKVSVFVKENIEVNEVRIENASSSTNANQKKVLELNKDRKVGEKALNAMGKEMRNSVILNNQPGYISIAFKEGSEITLYIVNDVVGTSGSVSLSKNELGMVAKL